MNPPPTDKHKEETLDITNATKASSPIGCSDSRKGAADFMRAGTIMEFAVEDGRLHRIFSAYQQALDRHAIVAVTDRRGGILFANEKFCAISGYSSEELVGNSHSIVNSGHHETGFFREMWRCITNGQVWHAEICNRSKSGTLYWVDTTIVPIHDSAGRIEAFVSIRYDITQRKSFEEALRQEVQRRREAEDLLRHVIETIPDGVAAFDAEDRLVVFNGAYADYLDGSRHVIQIGTRFEAILRHGLESGQYVLPKNSPESRETWLQSRLRDHRRPNYKTVQPMANGRWFQVSERKSASGHTIGTRTDITELKRSEAAIKHHAEHDALTGLFNRAVLEPRLSQAIANSVKTGAPGAIVMIDLDGFKGVNDTLGHAAGDALLMSVARRIESVLRRSDTPIRVGGDEFAIIFPQISESAIGKICTRLLDSVAQPLLHQDHVIKPRLSLGVALFAVSGATVEDTLRKADLALYHSKKEGGQRFCFYSHSLLAREESRRDLAGALAAAVATDQIDIAMQPQFKLLDKSPAGFEVLARWTHRGRQISPDEFISVADESGLAVALGTCVIERGLRETKRLKAAGLFFGKTAINVAEAQIAAVDFPMAIRQAVDVAGVAPQDIELELTENIILDRRKETIDGNLRQLRAQGFSIALDDFGTGYSSLSHLNSYEIDKIKIDRGFVARLRAQSASVAIVKALVGLAHDIGMTVVAEGIEAENQLSLLRELGCDFGQGFLLAEPMWPAMLHEFLRALSSKSG